MRAGGFHKKSNSKKKNGSAGAGSFTTCRFGRKTGSGRRFSDRSRYFGIHGSITVRRKQQVLVVAAASRAVQIEIGFASESPDAEMGGAVHVGARPAPSRQAGR